MKKLTLCSVALLLAAGSASSVLADERYDKDHSPPWSGDRGTLDCSAAIDAGCGFSYAGTNGSGINSANTYNCVTYNESGPENVFRFTLGVTSDVSIVMTPQGCDLDLFLLSACDEATCFDFSAGTTQEVITQDCLAPGTYYVVVDGYNGAICPYTIEITCAECTPPPENETCDLCADLGCGAIDFDTDTRGTVNNYDPTSSGCTGYNASGGDLVWCVCIPAGGELHLQWEEISYDGSIYLVTDCGDVFGSCLDGSDCFPPPCINFIDYVNNSGSDINAFLIVDGYGGQSGTGHLSGSVDCCDVIPVETSTWGRVKATYR